MPVGALSVPVGTGGAEKDPLTDYKCKAGPKEIVGNAVRLLNKLDACIDVAC